MSSDALSTQVLTVLEETLAQVSPEDRALVAEYLKQFEPADQLAALDSLVQLTWRQTPVGIRKFIHDAEYLNLVGPNGRSEIFPRLVDDLEELFSGQSYTEAVLTGGIGWGKSAFARLVHCYQIYQVGCLVNPAQAYGLQSGSKITFINVAVNKTNAREVVFTQVAAMLGRSLWFKRYLPMVRDITDHIEFENGVWLAPFAAAEKAVVGFDAFGGVIDEVNEMAFTFESTRKHRGEVVYDQAQALRDAIIRRMTSRFIAAGRLPGILVQMSSAKYPGEYTERRIAEAKAGDTSIFWRQYSTWDTKRWQFSKTTFSLALGSLQHAPFIIESKDDEKLVKDLKPEIVQVPDDLKSEFKKDIHSAIRDFVGRSTAALTPFISRIEKVFDAFQRGQQIGLFHPFTAEQSTLREFLRTRGVDDPLDGRFRWSDLKKRIDFTKKYFAHADLAKNKHGNGDRAGICIGHIAGYKLVSRRNEEGKEVVSKQPYVVIDLMIQIVAPPDDEIRIASVKTFLRELHSYGMRFASITFDQWQSLSTIQELKDAFISDVVEELSVDKKNDPYMELKDCFYEDRIDCYEYLPLQTELSALEKNEKTGKVDHPPGGSKDVSDALAAICFQMSLYKVNEKPVMMLSHGGSSSDPLVDRILQLRDRKASQQGIKPEAARLNIDDMLFGDADP